MPVAPQPAIASAEPLAQATPSAPEPASTRQIEVSELPPMVPAAPPAPTARSTAAPSSTAAAATGFWVQLGAFRERDGAETLLGEAARGLPSLAPQLRVFSEAGTHRLQAGPFPSRTAAGEAVTQLRESLRIAPMVVERR